MNLRGAFDPKIQMLFAAVTVTVYIHLMWLLATTDWVPSLDFWLAGPSLIAGAILGIYVGSLRLRALRTVLPEVAGQFYFVERGVLSKIREGENALVLQRNAWAGAFLVWFAVAALEGPLLYGSLASFIVGSYLTGQVLPFIRLYRQL